MPACEDVPFPFPTLVVWSPLVAGPDRKLDNPVEAFRLRNSKSPYLCEDQQALMSGSSVHLQIDHDNPYVELNSTAQ